MTQKIKILLVEDDEAIREMYRIKFESNGVIVELAEDGRQALDIARRLKPDLLLLDIKIPFIGGEEVFEKLLKEDWAKTMKVIVLTNISYSEAPEILRTERIDRYVVKAHLTPTEVFELAQEVMNE